MGGTMDLITAQNKGTEFIMKLNFELCEPIEEPEQESENEKNEIDFSDKTLLLVDDMEINRKMAKMLLENLGFKVETAENGKDAVDKVTSPENKYDAVLMDMRMPVMDGYEATRALRENDNPEIADIPIIAVTANAFAEDVKRAEKVGVSEYISKPIDPEKLKEVLTKIFSE
jgi:CheY-like chemotaxis protein